MDKYDAPKLNGASFDSVFPLCIHFWEKIKKGFANSQNSDKNDIRQKLFRADHQNHRLVSKNGSGSQPPFPISMSDFPRHYILV